MRVSTAHADEVAHAAGPQGPPPLVDDLAEAVPSELPLGRRVRTWLHRVVDSFLPSGPLTRVERRRMQAVVVGTLITLPFGLVAVQQIAQYVSVTDALLALAGFMVLAGCPFLLRWTGSATVPGLLQAGTLLALLFLMAFLDGGLDDPALYWALLLPMAAAITVGPLGSLVMMAAGLAGLSVLYVLTQQDHPFPNYSAGEIRIWFDMLSLTTGVVFSALVGWLYERHTRQELGRLSEGVEGLQGRLGRSEARYRLLFEHLPIGMYRTQADGEVVLANEAFLRMLGYGTLGEYRRERASIDESYADPEARAALTDRLLRQGRISQYEVDLRARDGRIVHARVNARVVYDARGAARYFEGTVEDVTAHRDAQGRLQQSEERFRALVSHSSDVIAMLGPEGRVAYLSPAFEKMFGRPAQIGARVLDFTHPEERRRVDVLLRRALARPGPLPTLELRLRHAQGHYVFVEVTGSNRLAEPHLRGLVLNVRDITERKRAEAVLLKSKEHAEDVAQFKSSFLANMSHEIRTPLTGILGFASVLVEEVPEEAHREFVRLIERSGRRLLDTLNSVLDLARLDAGRMELEAEPLRVGEAVREAVQLITPLADEKRLRLRVRVDDPDACALLDKGATSRIINNLVGNAIKFTQEGEVDVVVEADPGFVRLRVRDTGPGIDEAFLPRIFGEFEQESQGIGRDHEGTGLGLTITQRLVEKLGGAIEVVSRKGGGTTFTVTFPRSDEPGQEAPAVDAAAPGAAEGAVRPRVLVVDDNQQTRFLMDRMLRASYQVDTAATVEETYRRVEEVQYDAVLLDINLGAKTSGEDVMLRLREDDAYAAVPIIAFTAYALPGDRERFLNQGFDGYLGKPFTRKQLNDLMQEVLPTGVADAYGPAAAPSLLLGPYASRESVFVKDPAARGVSGDGAVGNGATGPTVR